MVGQDSKRSLRQEIKSIAFDRLSYADKDNISVITDNSESITIRNMIKDSIILNINRKNKEFDEKELLIKQIENRFLLKGITVTSIAIVDKGLKYVIEDGP